MEFHQSTDGALIVHQGIAKTELVVPVLVLNTGVELAGLTPEVADIQLDLRRELEL